jgi:hypothetical protein
MICGKLLLRPNVSRAYWDAADLGLTLGEYNIVRLLASSVGRYVTYRAIYDELHYEGFIAGSGADGYRANVRSAIKRIRNKIRDFDPSFDEIKTTPASGTAGRNQHKPNGSQLASVARQNIPHPGAARLATMGHWYCHRELPALYLSSSRRGYGGQGLRPGPLQGR